MKPEKSTAPVRHKPKSLTLVALALFPLLLKMLMTRMTMTKFRNSKGSWSTSMRKETVYGPPPFPQPLSTFAFALPLQSLSSWPRPSRKTHHPGIMKNTSQSIFVDSTTCSPRTPSMNYQSPNPGITPSNSFRKPTSLRVVRSTPCPSLSKRNSTPSSRRISRTRRAVCF